ncbi:dynein light chain Tctex-type 4-like [Sardina pilchardus]|uniref:dynein light chain Tctex-type 4-like n=1 Tax=Sardina pilchardus TaxID=27697 RepID=UPI002E0F0FFB
MDRCVETRRMSRVPLKETGQGNSKERDTLTFKEASTQRLSRQVQVPSLDRRLISLKGLLTAQKFSKGLKYLSLWLYSQERTAQKLAAKKGVRGPARKLIPIINDQVPTGCAQPKERFPVAHVSQLLHDFLASRLDGVAYAAGSCGPLSAGPLALALSEDLRALVRAICPPRYRLVCTVSLGPAGQEGLMMASRCLWDAHADTCISHTTQTAQIFCVASVFAVYRE